MSSILADIRSWTLVFCFFYVQVSVAITCSNRFKRHLWGRLSTSSWKGHGNFIGEIHHRSQGFTIRDMFGMLFNCTPSEFNFKLSGGRFSRFSHRWKPIHWEYSWPFDLGHSTLVWLGVSPDWRMPIDESPLYSISEQMQIRFCFWLSKWNELFSWVLAGSENRCNDGFDQFKAPLKWQLDSRFPRSFSYLKEMCSLYDSFWVMGGTDPENLFTRYGDNSGNWVVKGDAISGRYVPYQPHRRCSWWCMLPFNQDSL